MKPSSDSTPDMFDEKEGTLLNGIELHTVKAVGFSQTPIKAMCAYINETKITYLCGKGIVIYDLLTESQKSFSRGKDEGEVSTFNCFKTMYGEEYIIYATRSCKNMYPQINILNVWKSQTKSYVLYDFMAEAVIVDLLLIGQGSRFVMLSQEEKTSRIVMFNLDESAPFFNETLDIDVKGLFSLDSYSDDIYLFTESEIFNLRYVKENTLENISLDLLEGEKIVDAKLANMNEYTFVAITDQGYVVLKRILSGVQIREDLGTFETIENKSVVTKRRIPSALCVSETFVLIGYNLVEQLTLIKVHHLDFNKRQTEKISFNCPFIHKIVSLSFSEENTSVCMALQLKQQDKGGINMKVTSDFLTKKGDEYQYNTISNHHLPPGRIIPAVFNLVLHQTLMETFRSPIQMIMDDLVFYKSIININLIPYKKLILVLSNDRKIRAFRFDTTSVSLPKLFLWQHEYPDQPLAMDVHPSNFSVALMFKEGVRIHTIGSEGIIPTFYWNIKGCEAIQFSTFGHILAVATPSTIHLLNPYSTQIMTLINVHLGPIKEITFIEHDNFLYLHGHNGGVNIYTLTGSRRLDYNNKAMKSIASFYDTKNDMLIVSSLEGTTKFYKEKGTIEFDILWTFPVYITGILVINEFRCIIFATSIGTIRIHQWPFLDRNKFAQNFTEKVLHEGPITSMRMTHDMGYLITASQTSIYISKLQHYSDGLVTTQSEMINLVRTHNRDYLMLYHLDRLLICSNASNNLREEKIVQLEADRADNEDESDEKIVSLTEEYKKKFLEIEGECNQMKDSKSREFDKSISELTMLKKGQDNKIHCLVEELEVQREVLQEQKTDAMRRLYSENDDLKLQILNLKKQQLEDINRMKEEIYREEKTQTDDYERQVNKLQKMVQTTQSKLKNSVQTNNQTTTQVGQEYEIYQQNLGRQLDTQILDQEQKGIDLRKKNNQLIAQNIRYQFRKKELANVKLEIEGEIQELYEERQSNEDSIKHIAKVLTQQDNVINHSEKKAKEYLKKNIVETNKEQYLSHRTQELEQTNKELKVYLTELEGKQKDMYEEFVKESLDRKEAANKLVDSVETTSKLKETMKHLELEKHRVKYSILEMTSMIGNLLRDFPDGLEIEYQKLFESKKKTDIGETESVTTEVIDTLSMKVSNLIANAQKKKKLNETNDSIRKNVLTRVNHEAIALTSECNQLRYEGVKLTQVLKDLKIKLDEARLSYDQRNPLSTLKINVSAIAEKRQKRTKLPFEVLQEENKMRRMYQIMAKDIGSQAPLESKLQLLKHLKKMESDKVKCRRPVNKSVNNDSMNNDVTKVNSEGNSVTLPSLRRAEFSLILNSSFNNGDVSDGNILEKVMSEERLDRRY